MRLRILIPRDDGEDDRKPTSTKVTPPPTPTSYYNIPLSTKASSTTAVVASKTAAVLSTSSASSTSKSSSSTTSSISSTSAKSTSAIMKSTSFSTTTIRWSKPPVAATASSTLISSTRSSSTPTLAADLLAPTALTPQAAQIHNVASNTLIVFGSLGIAAILIMLAAVLIILKKKRRPLPSNTQFITDTQPGGPSPQPQIQMRNAYVPPKRTTASDEMSYASRNNTATHLTWNNNTPSEVSMPVPIPPLRAAESYQQYIPPPLNVYREERRGSLNYDRNPFADPPYRSDIRGNVDGTEGNLGPFADPPSERPVARGNPNNVDVDDMSFTPPPYGHPPNSNPNPGPLRSPPTSESNSSKSSNFKSLLHPNSISNTGTGEESRRRTESQSTVGIGSKFSNFGSLLGSGAGSGSGARVNANSNSNSNVEAAWEAEERRRMEDQRRALAMLAGQQVVMGGKRGERRAYF